MSVAGWCTIPCSQTTLVLGDGAIPLMLPQESLRDPRKGKNALRLLLEWQVGETDNFELVTLSLLLSYSQFSPHQWVPITSQKRPSLQWLRPCPRCH